MKYTHLDAEGRTLQVGDTVRVIGVPPDIQNWSDDQKAFSLPAFHHLVGKYKRIADFDEYGHAEIRFRMKEADAWGDHTVWLEPRLLKLKQKWRMEDTTTGRLT